MRVVDQGTRHGPAAHEFRKRSHYPYYDHAGAKIGDHRARGAGQPNQLTHIQEHAGADRATKGNALSRYYLQSAFEERSYQLCAGASISYQDSLGESPAIAPDHRRATLPMECSSPLGLVR